MVRMESAPGSSEDLSKKCRQALKSIVAKLTALPALDALVHQPLPEAVIKLVLEQVGWVYRPPAVLEWSITAVFAPVAFDLILYPVRVTWSAAIMFMTTFICQGINL